MSNRELELDVESEKCNITRPYEALVGNFSEKLIHHVSKTSRFGEGYIKDIYDKIKDNNQTLTEDEGKDFLDFINENEKFFDIVIKKNKGNLLAWVQSPISEGSMDMEKEDHVLYEDGKYQGLTKIREYIKTRTQWNADSETSSVEQSSEGVTGEMKNHMDDRNTEMSDGNRLSRKDMEKLYKLPLSVREEGGEKIISLEGFGEFGSTVNSGMQCRDMDKNGKREIDNLSESEKFLTFKEKVKGMEMMSLQQTYKLMNMIGKQLGIEEKIDLNYINTVFKNYPDKNLPKDNNLGRILRCLSVILGTWFVIPVSVNGKTVRSVGCDDDHAGIYDDYIDNDISRPLFEVVSSPSQ